MIANDFPLNNHDRALVDVFGDAVFAIGGRVRDHFISKIHGHLLSPKDLDYVVCGITLDDVTARLTRIGKSDNVGKSFAGIKVTRPDGEIIEIALARRERSTGPGHKDFEVSFGPEVTILEDASRRDITINSISVRLADRQVFAPADAFADLEIGIIRQASTTAFAEDPLRILRAVQFAARFAFSFTIEPVTLAAMGQEAHRITTVTPERISEELTKLLSKSAKPSVGINILREQGLLPLTLPELGEGIGFAQNDWHLYDVFNHNCKALDIAAEIGGDLTDRFAALMHDVGKPRTVGIRSDGRGASFHGHEIVSASIVRQRLTALRFPNELVDDVSNLAGDHMYTTQMPDGTPPSDAALRRFMRKVGRGSDDHDVVRERLERQFALRHADRHAGSTVTADVYNNAAFERRIRAELDRVPAMTVKQLDIKGTDVMAAIIAAGLRPTNYRGDKLISIVLKALLENVTDEPRLNAESTLKAMIPQHLSQLTPA